MAALAITATSVIPVSATSFTSRVGQLGEAGTAGQVLYKKSTDGKWYKAQSDGTAEESGSGVDMGICLAGAGTNQYTAILLGGTITIGATIVAFTPYYVHTTAGSICLFSDLASTNYVTKIGDATSTTVLNVSFAATGGALA